MKFADIKYLVFSSELENESFILEADKQGKICVSCADARSAVYVATGICAQNREAVAVCLNGSNASRSAFSGMTEAFYRNLPIVLITLGNELDYSRELNDVIYKHYVVSDFNEIKFAPTEQFPVHVEILGKNKEIEKIKSEKIQEILRDILCEKDYLYIGQGVDFEENSYQCKIVKGGMPNCYEGALSNVLGASLAKKRERYIGLVSEEEFIHDMNTLGNIHVNDSLLFIVIAKRRNKMIENYAKSLSFETCSELEGGVKLDKIESVVKNKRKTVLMVFQED